MRVLETCLYVSDLAAAADFYGGLLGFPVISQVAGRHLFLRAGDGVLLLFVAEATEREQALPPHGARGSQHVAFAVAADEIDGWIGTLAAAGVPVLAVHEWSPGRRSIYFHDPAGNLLELAPASIWGIGEP